MATTAIMAQDAPIQTTEGGNNATLLQPAGDYIYYGNQVMNKKECVKFLAKLLPNWAFLSSVPKEKTQAARRRARGTDSFCHILCQKEYTFKKRKEGSFNGKNVS